MCQSFPVSKWFDPFHSKKYILHCDAVHTCIIYIEKVCKFILMLTVWGVYHFLCFLLSYCILSYCIPLYYCLFHLFSLNAHSNQLNQFRGPLLVCDLQSGGEMLGISLLNITFLDNHVHSYPAFVPKMHRLLRWLSFCSVHCFPCLSIAFHGATQEIRATLSSSTHLWVDQRPIVSFSVVQA